VNHASRIERLMDGLERPLLITSLVNIRYLTGFTGTSAYLVAGPDRNLFITDGRYAEIAGELITSLPATELIRHSGAVVKTLNEALGDAAALDVEADHVSWSFATSLAETLSASVHPSRGVVEKHRKVKDGDEVAALTRAAAAGDAAFSRLDTLVGAAHTEGDLGLGLIEAMREAGGEAAGWPPIVAVGPNAARPHHRSGEGHVDGTGLLLLDYGCVVDGYNSDMTRTVWLGAGPEGEMAKVHAAVLESNEAGIAAVGPGVRAHDVDEACRAVLRSHGYEEYFVHSTGHGVGLEIHEAPWVKRKSEDVLEPGHVVTIEPGVYLPGRGGVRIEDMVLVTDSGGEVLTRSRKELRTT
jgi:Xaa-Pro aminopeptidase